MVQTMDAFGIIGMVFGMAGLSFAIMAWTQVQGTAKEVADMKEALRKSGALPEGKP